MRLLLALSVLLACLPGPAQGPRLQAYRQWLGGQEVGGSTRELRREGLDQVNLEREWLTLARLGQEILQEVSETTRKHPDGTLAFQWRMQLSAEPFEGTAQWSPLRPTVLSIQPKGGAELTKEVPPGALLWPEDLAVRLKEAARKVLPLQAITFSFPIQQWSQLDLQPTGPAPLPGFPDAIRFTGRESQGGTTATVEIWVSPEAGELKHRSHLGTLTLLSQRRELPNPVEPAGTSGFFERTLQTLPPHPFQPWLEDLTLRAEGGAPDLPVDAQQQQVGTGHWRLHRALAPTGVELTQGPSRGAPTPAEARYLAPTPLVPFQDPAFDGLLRRLALPPGLSRWEMARRVTDFVFEWITEKDFSVGFASALEVCRSPRGDCTEHGVLAVALLRKLGVPARGVTGWVGLGEVLGLHFWVEVHIQDRWIPVDPTFDQAPASALRLKLGDSDLADLGTLGWEGAAMAFSGVRWIPERVGGQPWPGRLDATGDVLEAPGGLRLRLRGAKWTLEGGQVQAQVGMKKWQFRATPRPGEQQLSGCRRLAGPTSLRTGWWDPATKALWLDLGAGRWGIWSEVPEPEAYQLLDQLMVLASRS